MRIVLVVEGASEDGILKCIVPQMVRVTGRKLNIDVIKMRGHGRVLDPELVERRLRPLLALHRDVTKIIALVDRDCSPQRELEMQQTEAQLAQTTIRPGVRYCLVVEAIEAWLLADEIAISTFIGTKITIPSLEELCHPGEWLDRIAKRHHRDKGNNDRGYKKVRDGTKIACNLAVNRAMLKSRSLAIFGQMVSQ